MSSRRPQSQATAYSSHSSSSSASSSYYGDSYTSRSSVDSSSRQSMPRVETLRCSRCAKCVETVVSTRSNGELRGASTGDASASGMVKFGHNLYYCERCAKMVGYA
ncbi:hypothetical protein B0J14DRAFT_489040 [Halenospora varia]|nr:hypothetical protein B0J14DRAFT_489040 [Halenospora varia]